MVDQVQHFDVCSVVNNRQTGAMTLQVRTHTNSVSDVNLDSEKVEGLCFPLLGTCSPAILVAVATLALLARAASCLITPRKWEI